RCSGRRAHTRSRPDGLPDRQSRGSRIPRRESPAVRSRPTEHTMPSCKITMAVDDQAMARTVSGALTDLIEPAPDAVTTFEAAQGWLVEGYYPGRPDIGALARRLREVLPFSVPHIGMAAVP